MYKRIDGRVNRVRRWASTMPANTKFGITEAARRFRSDVLSDYASPSGYGGQTVARILCEDCGWIRDSRSVRKQDDTV